MFVAHAVRALMPPTPLLAVDMCAAPGGKSTAVLDAVHRGSFLVANEYVEQRAAILRENIMKWGRNGVAVTRGDTMYLAKALRASADLVIADMPCSGEGMMRKSEEARTQWSPALVRDCMELQRKIAENAWNTLSPGGVLLYSTCTFNTHENEENIIWMIENFGAEPLSIPTNPGWGITGAVPGFDIPVYRFMPGRTPGEGLFVAALRKPGVLAERPEVNGVTTRSDAEARWVFPTAWQKVIERLSKQKGLTLMSAGTQIAQAKGRGYIRAHALAMSAELPDETTPRYELDLSDALAYLRRENVTTPEAPRGLVMVTYSGYPLGYVNNLGNRANNLYPSNYRIRNKRV